MSTASRLVDLLAPKTTTKTSMRTRRTPKANRADNPTASSSQPMRSTQSAALVLRIPRRLESPNASRGAHWRVRHRIAQAWFDELGGALYEFLSSQRTPLSQVTAAIMDMQGGSVATRRMRVTIERHVPSTRNFIRDDDNLAFASKPILDALKRQGYIRDDSRKWLEHPTPTQQVSTDGKDYTVIRIEAAGR